MPHMPHYINRKPGATEWEESGREPEIQLGRRLPPARYQDAGGPRSLTLGPWRPRWSLATLPGVPYGHPGQAGWTLAQAPTLRSSPGARWRFMMYP